MNIICWNVNGLRALHKKGNFKWLLDQSPDFFCLQEVKAEPDQLLEEIRNCVGYNSYFSHSKNKKGYSGVAVYAKKQPERVEYGIGAPEFDDEGRILALYYKDFVLFNVYFPNGGGGPERLDYKLRFYDAFLKHIEKIHNETGNPTSQGSAGRRKIIFCGDVNTAHEEIDLARPKENEDNTGFLPEERAWIDELVNHGYVDAYRYFFPNMRDAYTYWDMKTAARERNVGWRIDYFFVSNDAVKNMVSCRIHFDIYGSDHCPLELKLKGLE